jgi:large subunit ribosomal protein L1
VIKLKDLDLKKPDQHVDFFAQLNHGTGKKVRVAALIGPEMKADTEAVVDLAIITDDFDKYDKKKAKKLAESYDYFIAQANIMPKVAQVFGKILGTRGKMPNPKAGCVVPPKSNLKPLYDKLQKTVRVKAKELLAIQCRIGTEKQPEQEVADNIITIYKQLVHHLPNHENNISKVLLKLTMGKVVEIK